MDPFQLFLHNELSNQKMHRGDQIQTIHLFMHHLDPAQIAQWDDTQRQVVYRQLFLRAVHDAASGMAACSSAAVAEAIANSELYELTSGYGRGGGGGGRGPHTPPPMDCMTPPPEESFYATALREAYRLSAARSAFYSSPLRNLRAGPSTSYLLDYHQILAGKDAFPAFSLESTLAAEHNFQVLPTEDGVNKLPIPDHKGGENLAQPDPRCLPFFSNDGSFDYPVEDDYEMSYSDESVATLSDEEASSSCSPRDAEKHMNAPETVQGQETFLLQNVPGDPALDLSKGDCRESAVCRDDGAGVGGCSQVIYRNA